MNAEILARLENSFRPNLSVAMADLLQPMTTLSERDKVKLGELLVNVGEILSKGSSSS